MFAIQDYPMLCCGMAQAFGITENEFSEVMGKYQEGFDPIFEKIEQHLREHRRNVGMVTLSRSQSCAKECAEKRGWKVVHSFWNPNSWNTVYILMYTLWDSREDYKTEQLNGNYVDPDVDQYQNTHHFNINELESI